MSILNTDSYIIFKLMVNIKFNYFLEFLSPTAILIGFKKRMRHAL